MITGTSLLKNGRVTGPLPSVKDLVKNKIVHAITASRYWSSSENSQNNSWNVNFSNGNFNNNNKYNSNMVRAVAALNDKYVEGWFDALDDCCAQKKTSSQCVMYRLIWHEDLLDLAREVYERTYRPTTSTCFIVTRPKLREVFAANFRDRIVQHWLCLRLEPLFEARFVEHGNVSFNCRKGFGTFACIDQLTKNTIEVSDDYSHEAWYAQFDIKGFFMSIDCERLLEHLLPFIKEKIYGGQTYSVTEYTMSEIIASVYEKIEQTGIKEGILFIDEINCVSETLAPTMLQFLQGKTFGNQKIPQGWIIVAAGNPPEYNKSVREFDIVTLDRIKKINVEANLDVWKEYASFIVNSRTRIIPARGLASSRNLR